jgi:hypothetical protein
MPMSAFEWQELQTLAGDITAARFQLTAARSANDQRLIRSLEQEITAAEERRAQLVAHLTSNLADTADDAASPPPQPPPRETATESEAAEHEADEDAVLESEREDAASLFPPPEVGDPIDHVPMRVESSRRGAAAGDAPLWQQLTPADIERARAELALRRAEMLARHAEELNALEADYEQLDALELAIVDFLRKFGTAPALSPPSPPPRDGAANSDHSDDQLDLRLLAGE